MSGRGISQKSKELIDVGALNNCVKIDDAESVKQIDWRRVFSDGSQNISEGDAR